MWDLVGNREDRFSHNEAQLSFCLTSPTTWALCPSLRSACASICPDRSGFFVRTKKGKVFNYWLSAQQTSINTCTVMTLSFRTERSWQTVQTLIRLLLEEQSDQGLHCLLFHCIFLTKYPEVWPHFSNFK